MENCKEIKPYGEEAMAKNDTTRNRMTQIEMAEFENICREYWNDGYDDRAIALMTGKRLDMVRIVLWKLFSVAGENTLEAILHERTKFIVSKTCTIKSIGNWKTCDFYEASKDDEGNILLTPFDK